MNNDASCAVYTQKWKYNRMNIFSIVSYDTQDFQISLFHFNWVRGDQIAKSVDFTNRSFNEMSFRV